MNTTPLVSAAVKTTPIVPVFYLVSIAAAVDIAMRLAVATFLN